MNPAAAMEPLADKLLCYEHEGQHYGLPFIPGESIRIGTDPECEVHVSGEGISTQHIRLDYLEDGQVRVTGLEDATVFTSGEKTGSRLLSPPFDLLAGPHRLSFILMPWEQAYPAESRVLAEKNTPATRPQEKKRSQPTMLRAASLSDMPWMPPPPPARSPSKTDRAAALRKNPGIFAASLAVGAVFWWGIYSLEIRHPQLSRHSFMRQQAASQLQEMKNEKARITQTLESAQKDLTEAQKRLDKAGQTSQSALKELADARQKYAPTPPAKDKPMSYLDVRGWLAGQSQSSQPSILGLTGVMVSEELIISLLEQGSRQIEAGQMPKGLAWMQLAREAAALKNEDASKLRSSALTGMAYLVDNQPSKALESLEAALAKLQQPRAQPQLAGALNLALADARLRLGKVDEAAQCAEEARVYAVSQGHSLREAAANILLAKVHRRQNKPHLVAEHYRAAVRALRNQGDWDSSNKVDELASQADREAQQMQETDTRTKRMQESEQFVREAVQIENLQDINGIMRNYAQVVDYFDKGNIYRNTVEEDKLSYFSRYPHAVHTLISPITLTEQANGSVLAEFTTAYHLINTAGESKRGTTRQMLTLERQFFQWVIVRQRAQSTPDGSPQPQPAASKAAPASPKPAPRSPPASQNSGDNLRDRARRFNDL